MSNDGLLNKVMGASPSAEMVVRRLYRNQILNQFLKRFKTKVKGPKLQLPETNAVSSFQNILEYLKNAGVQTGDILVVHSAFSPLKKFKLSPEQIVDQLFSLVGPTGTLVMPVIRHYPEEPAESEALHASVDHICFIYDVQKSPVWTGVIPKTLMQKPEARVSRFPLNTVAAIGPEAEAMIKDNLEGDLPTANGIHSAWKYCADRNAWIVSLGTDLTHSLTMIHTAEDTNTEAWPIQNWYRKKKFKIIDGSFRTEKTVLERHPRWGMLHYGERKLCQDLIDQKVMKSENVNGILIETLRSQNLIQFLNRKNSKGYPYFWVRPYLK